MTYNVFGSTYTFLTPEWLWLLVFLPLLWLPVFWQRQRLVIASAALLHTLAAVLIVAALAGLSTQTILAEHKLAAVAAADVSDSISPEGRAWTREYLTRLVHALEPEDEIAILSFAADTGLLVPPGTPTDLTLPADALKTAPAGRSGGTNIAKALERALSLYPEEAEKRLLLITDGNETNGAARQHIALARQMGVKIFPVIPPSGQHPEVSLEKFIVPPLVREGSAFSVRLVVRNGNEKPVRGSATVIANDQTLTRQEVKLDPGLSVLEVPAQILQRGNYLLRADIKAAPDTIEGNNHQSTSLAVAGKVRSLVITDNPKTQLARALQMKEVDTEFRRPEGLPTQLSELLDYNCLVFDDIGRSGISSQQMTAIESYVRDFGGGFLIAGGLRTFGDLGYKGTTIERILPVTFQEQRPKKKKRTPIALFLLIDRSNSMGYNSKIRGLHDGQKMQYAQKAALELLSQLQDTDFAGAIAFDSEPYLLAPLAPLADNRADLTSKISRLQYGGGTDFYGALETAADQLARNRGSIRHIILLTDGDSNRSPFDHYPLVATIAQRQISVTTIRIGADTVNLQLLSYMAEKTGGRFYHVEDVEVLPQLIIKDTKQVMRDKDDDEDKPKEIIPRLGERGQVLQGLDDFPSLDEYMLTKPKSGAAVQLYTDVHTDHDPLLATWQYGLGKVVTVTFDPSGSGSSDWIRWDGYGKFWSQAVRWAMRDETPWDYRLSVQQRGERMVLRAESYDNDEDGVLLARLPRGAQADELTLMPVAPRVYEAALSVKRQGSFPVTVVKRKGGKVVNQKNEIVMAAQATGESLDEYRQQHPNRDLLRELAASTGGRIDPDLDELISQKREGQKKLIHPLDNYLIIASLTLLLGDIAIRVWLGPPV
ncbi:MAG TPA: VWA domain-containing protein [Candidatus Binatia bacterium]|jgi:Mg-chelatase subunit ChlD|nr:VWA domain-containing protein [Candidatus Binatia bacterium]